MEADMGQLLPTRDEDGLLLDSGGSRDGAH
jgi:hypothetical protein